MGATVPEGRRRRKTAAMCALMQAASTPRGASDSSSRTLRRAHASCTRQALARSSSRGSKHWTNEEERRCRMRVEESQRLFGCVWGSCRGRVKGATSDLGKGAGGYMYVNHLL